MRKIFNVYFFFLKAINEYFYNSLGNFQGFHLVKKIDLNPCTSSNINIKNDSTQKIKHLVLRKRKSFSNMITNDTDDSSDRSSSNNSSLNFGESDDDCKSKFKKVLKKSFSTNY